jgi:type IV fimbrial biogenesis protein FimT
MVQFSTAAKRMRSVAWQRHLRCGGFTILELLITVSIVAIMAAVAAPSLADAIARQREKSAASELLSSLLRARSEAVGRNSNVTLAPVAGGWQQGWKILDPANASTILDSHGVSGGLSISGPTSVVYDPSGRVRGGVAPMFVVTGVAGSTSSFRCVSVALSGRPYQKAAATC